MVVATFGQNRFGYYFAVNVAVLTAYLSWRALEFAGLREAPDGIEVQEDTRDRRGEKERGKTKQGNKSKQRKGKAKKREQRVLATRYLSARNVYVSMVLIVVFFLAFYPNIGVAINRVKANTGVDNDWNESLVWMRDNTPDPFNNPGFYYELHQRPPARGAYQYPESAYGVMSWWDYGYYITYIAHRIPNASPNGQAGAADAASFFVAQDEASGSQVLDRLGSKYVIVDSSMAIGKFYAMAVWAGKDQSQFFDVFYQSTQTGTLQPVMLYYPEYYQSMCSRLYLFAGEEWVPQQVLAVSWNERQLTSTDGSTFTAKVVSDQKSFSTYDSAKAFVDVHQDYRIVGTSPVVSPVPLEKLDHYKLIHQSPTIVSTQQQGNISEVEIFQYSP
jgi:dolichyl-diphosphooligosaccharide--protein glycosyltransferase